MQVSSKTMRAILVTELGGPEVLRVSQQPIPEVAAGSVRVRVQAVGLNFADMLSVSGEYLTRTRLPFIPGMEFAGTIDAVGTGVTHLEVGQLVACLGGTGAFAEFSVVPASSVLPTPDGLSAPEAAALPVSFYTAFFALQTLGQAITGEVVLIEAAAGALGTASIQMAKALGCKVIALASSQEKINLAKSLGADVGLVSNQENLMAEIRAAAQSLSNKKDAGVDVYLSVVGGPGFEDKLSLMSSRGRIMVIGNASREAASLNPTMLMRKNVSAIGVWLTPLLQEPDIALEATVFIGQLLQSKKAKPIVGQVFSLENAAKAFEFMQSRQNTGKIIIAP